MSQYSNITVHFKYQFKKVIIHIKNLRFQKFILENLFFKEIHKLKENQ